MIAKDMRTEKATAADIEWLAQAQVAMARETENLNLAPEIVASGVKYIFDHPDRGFYLVARKDQLTPIGCLLILKEWSDWRNGDVWWIHSVYVLPTERGQGIFQRMFDRVEAMARDSGVRGLRLYVDKTNVRAQRIYEGLGMNKDHYLLYEKMLS
jgi:GNAT superfamily N-acetyltransferase